MKRPLKWLALLTLVLGSAPGCCHDRHQASYIAPPSCSSCGVPPTGRIVPIMSAPPQPIPATMPPPAQLERPMPPAPEPPPTEAPPSPPTPDGAGARLLPPNGESPDIRLSPRRSADLPPAAVPPKTMPKAEDEEPPFFMPDFRIARPNVASGRKPYPDSIDWLKDKGYKVALHVHPPAKDKHAKSLFDQNYAADKRMFESKGMRYLTLEVSPATLTRDVVDRFKQLITDPNNLPLFVYDKDGALLGGLWYLHFRLHEGQSDEQARRNAIRLGANPDDEEHRTMWVAIQALLLRKP